MARKDISIVRIVSAVAIVVASAAALRIAFMAGELQGMQRQRDAQWSKEVMRTRWRPDPAKVDRLADIETFGVRKKQPGNAADYFWPAGIGVNTTRCSPSTAYGGYDASEWSNDRWREAARCERIDEIVRAAQATTMDLSAWLKSPDAIGTIENPWVDISHAPVREIGALIARSHLRIEEGDLAAAEADARAAVSAGLHFVRGAPDVGGMLFGSFRVSGALDHLRVIYERQGRSDEAARVAQAQQMLKDMQSLYGRFQSTLIKAAALPEMQDHLVRIASDTRLPPGFRYDAATVLGYACMVNWTELLMGPNSQRLERLNALESDPSLAAAVARGRLAFDMPLRQRFKQIEHTWPWP